MKYMAIIDAEEKPVSCEFIGCNGNVAPYLIGATTDIKELRQGEVLNEIWLEIEGLKFAHEPNIFYEIHNKAIEIVLRIIDRHRKESEGDK